MPFPELGGERRLRALLEFCRSISQAAWVQRLGRSPVVVLLALGWAYWPVPCFQVAGHLGIGWSGWRAV